MALTIKSEKLSNSRMYNFIEMKKVKISVLEW